MGYGGTPGLFTVAKFGIPLLVENSLDYDFIEVRIARFELDPAIALKTLFDLYFVGFLVDAGGVAPVVDLRLYDVGAPNVPQTGDLRATITTTTTGSIIRESVSLTASDTPTTPNGDPNDGTIYSAVRIYELRAIFTAGDAGDTMQYDTVGILV